MTVGTELKRAREIAGLSPEQISERTKIQLYKIDALENNTFELLPQGIYLDGIVRAFANEVAIDADRMVERVRLERGKLPGDWEIPFAAPIDLHGTSAPRNIHFIDVPKVGGPLDSFAAEKDLAAAPNAPLALNAPVAPNALVASHARHAPNVPARPARGHALLALPVLALLAAGWSVYLYESNHTQEPITTADTSASVPHVESPTDTAPTDMAMTDAPATPRNERPTDVPAPFGENATSSGTDRRGASHADESAAPTSSPRSRPVEPPTTGAAASTHPDSVGTSGSRPDVSGSWQLATHVESSSYSPFAGLQLGYEMTLEQDGERVTGVGRKVTENGSGIGTRAQTPLTVSGTIAGDRLTLNFVERGTQRPTQGKFVLLVDEVGTLRGRFSSDAARSSGRVEAYRVSTQ